jgi:heptose-I-phosphate ethanolaminephosphotransferase
MNILRSYITNSYFLNFSGFLIPLSVFLIYDIYSLPKIFSYLTFAFFIILFSYIFESKWIYLFVINMGSMFFATFIFIEIAYLHTFGHHLTVNAIPVFLETNYNETSDFMVSYFDLNLILIAVSFLASVLLNVVWSVKFFSMKPRLFGVKYNLVLFILMVPILFFLKDLLLPYISLKSIYKYNKERKEILGIKIHKNGYFKNIPEQDNEIELGVVIIGESISKWNMGLYNYYRNTSPLLKERQSKGDLYVYSDVISPNTHTIPSLSKSLTLGGYNGNLKYNHSIIQILNAAGYKTFWISNQNPTGIYEATIRLISKTSEVSIFTGISERQLDEETFLPLRNILKDDSKKKFVFIHLLGCHTNYISRYPEGFDVFKSKPITNYNHNKAYEVINQYDNCILYNDYIVNSIISVIEKEKKKAFVLYFSDHGDDVYQQQNNFGHDESIGTEPMYEIPFLIWLSNGFDKSKISYDSKRKYITTDLVHSILDLAQIKVSQYDSTKSIFNECFQEKKRIILGDKVFDEYFDK